jgi:hypothetical protein
MKPERDILRTLLIAASALGSVLFRNPRGIERIALKSCAKCQREGRVVSYGLCNGASDLIGWTPHVVTLADVGRTVGLFTAVEVKRESGGRVSEDQRRFLAALERAGAVAGVARSVSDLEEILRAPRD